MTGRNRKNGGKMRNGSSWRLLPFSVPVADTEGEVKDDRLKLTVKGASRGRQKRHSNREGGSGALQRK